MFVSNKPTSEVALLSKPTSSREIPRYTNSAAVFWQCPTFTVKFQSRPRQIRQFRGDLEKRLVKNEKNRIVPNKSDICTLDIMVDFHWKNEANR